MRHVAIDFETRLISNEEPNPYPVCLSYYDGEVVGINVGVESIEAFLNLHLDNPDTTIIAHNAKFELAVIYTHMPRLRPALWRALEQGRIYCTMLYEQLLSNLERGGSENNSLAALTLKYLEIDIAAGKEEPDAWRYRYAELENVPLKNWPRAARQYAEQDSIYAHKIHALQQKRNSKIPYVKHMRADFALNLMATNGMTVDHARVLQLEQELADHIQPIYKELEAKGLVEFKKGKAKKSIKGLRNYIEQLGDIQFEYTSAGSIATSKAALEKYMLKAADHTLSLFAELSKFEKILTAFVPRLKEASPYIRCGYNAIVRSGRTSSRTTPLYPSVNIQQMPREVKGVTWDVRNCFVPRPGYQFVSIDYNGLELSATANQLYATFGWSKMRDTINSGEAPVDMHSKFAARLMSLSEGREVSYEEFVKNKGVQPYKRFRQLAKPINLGFPGGIGYDTMRGLLAREGIQTHFQELASYTSENMARFALTSVRINANEAGRTDNWRVVRKTKDTWIIADDELVGLKRELFRLYPELGQFLRKRHENYTMGGGSVLRSKNDFGEWEEEPAYEFNTAGVSRKWCTYTAFCNGFLMQTPAASGAKEMVYRVVKEYFDSEEIIPSAFIHDELVFEVQKNLPDYKKELLIGKVAAIMIDEMQKVLPYVRIAVEANLMDYWQKSSDLWTRTYWKDAKR